MKASTSSQEKKISTTLSNLETSLEKIPHSAAGGQEGGTGVEMIGTVEKMLDKMEDSLVSSLTKVVAGLDEGVNTGVSSILERLEAGDVVVKKDGKGGREDTDEDRESVKKVCDSLSSQLDDVHDMIAGVEEKIVNSLQGVQKAVSIHDKQVAGSINKVARI